MVASRNLLLPIVAAFVTGFGLSAVVAQTTNAAPPPSSTVNADDPFGEQVTMPELTIVYVSGSGQWDNAYETIVAAFKTVNGALDKLKVKAAGPPMTIYTETNDTGFKFQAAVPVKEAPKDLPAEGEIKAGKSPSGTALKFVHRGSYDAMDTTYEAITDHLEERKLEAKDLFVEQYMKDPTTTPDDELVIEIYVPLKGEAGAAVGQKGP